ncbi:MAG: DNA repair protein rad2 [Geoglossum umbratile]|nr:MAG: DNA repair protein rad2 [Geoglossum umbratile]
MGVTGLWTVLQPCARPTKLETLNKKRLAVDASIWIYQFLKAVRDKEGNALQSSHVVGFFRRICKLLYFGIKPVFVFDGDAPALKRQTIAGRKRRREGRREDAARTAGKLLAVQMQRQAEEEVEKRRQERQRRVPASRWPLARGATDVLLRPVQSVEEEEIPEDLVYVDELQMTPQERRQNRRFKKKDAYHLPDLDVSLEEMGAPNDPRIMSHEELEEYARQFHNGEDVNMYDFSKIDFNSPFFQSLPAPDRYNILNAARLRSRLRMGYSKDQLDSMFPDRMAFSRFQIERVAERNELTQRLMNINGMNDEQWVNHGTRVAGERGREYVLVKNDGVEGGWVLGVVGGKEQGGRNQPIDVEQLGEPVSVSEGEGEWEDEDGFEDVPIEGLNRLPKHSDTSGVPLELDDDYGMAEVETKRKAFYETRRQNSGEAKQRRGKQRLQDPNSLFVTDDEPDEGWEDINEQDMTDLFEDTGVRLEDDEELNRAIAMSLDVPSPMRGDEDEELNRAIAMSLEQSGVEDHAAGKGKGRLVDRPVDCQGSGQHSSLQVVDDSDDDVDIQAVLDESRRMQSRRQADIRLVGESSKSAQTGGEASQSLGANSFGGPLPFEKLDFSRSILRGKRTNPSGVAGKEQKEKAIPLPPWFSGDVATGLQPGGRAGELELDGRNLGERDVLAQTQPMVSRKMISIVEIDSREDEKVVGNVGINSEPGADSAPRGTRAKPFDLEAEKNKLELPGPEQRKSLDGGQQGSDEELFEWEDSDREEPRSCGEGSASATRSGAARSPSPIFEDVEIPEVSPPLPLGSSPTPIIESHDYGMFEGEDADQYSDPEDEELMRQLAVEAEEHARFALELNQKPKLQNKEDYERELKALRSQQKKDRRDADEVSNVMVTECQQLLKLFGLPYITAPMEAEAQCAELVRLGLVDGIVTDDSDTFLFGGTRVYKNMFNQAKYVECFLANDFEKDFDLDRRKLIRMAHLLGSDYTDGLPGVGPVTALEILSEFNSEDGLEEFKGWWNRIQLGNPGPDDLKTPFRKKFKRNANKIFLAPNFPDERVDIAYLEPNVDSDPTTFQWGVPDLDALRSFLMATIGWTQERTDEVLVPVIKDMNRRENEGTQANITNYFAGSTGAGAFAPRRRGANKSKRMGDAMVSLQQQAKRKRSGPEQRRTDGSESSGSGSDTGTGKEALDTVTLKKSAPRMKRPSRAISISSASDSATSGLEAPKKPQKRSRGSTRRRGSAKAA